MTRPTRTLTAAVLVLAVAACGPAGPASGPATDGTPEAQPSPSAPDLVVDGAGCVTDQTTGLVVTCHDDAAGPD